MSAAIRSVFERRRSEIDSLNGLRALSISGIIFLHFYHALLNGNSSWSIPEYIHVPISNLVSFMDLFFLLSGFLISAGLNAQWQKIGALRFGEYFIRRTLRIFPAYYFFLIIYTVIVLRHFPATLASGPDHLTEMLQTLFVRLGFDALYIGNYAGGGICVHTWSLAVEEHFYLVFPFLAHFVLFRLNAPRRIIVLLTLYLLPAFFRFYSHYQGAIGSEADHLLHIYIPTHTRADSIILGILVMELAFNHRTFLQKIARPAIANLLATAAMILLFIGHTADLNSAPLFYNVFRFNFFNIGFGLLLILSLRPGSLSARIFGLRLFTPIARLSYSMYLWHLTGSEIIMRRILAGKQGGLEIAWIVPVFLLVCATVLLLAFASYVLVEFPFMNYRATLLKRIYRTGPRRLPLAAADISTAGARDIRSTTEKKVLPASTRFTAALFDIYLIFPVPACIFFYHLAGRKMGPAWGIGMIIAGSTFLLFALLLQTVIVRRHSASFGKWLFGLRVVTVRGERLSFGGYVLRRWIPLWLLLPFLLPIQLIDQLRGSRRMFLDRLGATSVIASP